MRVRYNADAGVRAEPPEEKARETIDKLLTEAGWIVQSREEANGRRVGASRFENFR